MYFRNFSEIYKKIFAYFQVAIGQSGYENIGALCLRYIWHDANK